MKHVILLLTALTCFRPSYQCWIFPSACWPHYRHSYDGVQCYFCSTGGCFKWPRDIGECILAGLVTQSSVTTTAKKTASNAAPVAAAPLPPCPDSCNKYECAQGKCNTAPVTQATACLDANGKPAPSTTSACTKMNGGCDQLTYSGCPPTCGKPAGTNDLCPP